MTGNRPLPSLKYSTYGAAISKELGAQGTYPVLWPFPREPQRRPVMIVRYGKLIPELV